MFTLTTNFLQRNLTDYNTLNAGYTAKEIAQQAQLWQSALNSFDTVKESLYSFLNANINPHTRIIFTGAGTSEFVGNTIAPYLYSRGLRNIESISTTNLVLAPNSYLSKDDDILLVSCARSGDSPESVAAVELVNQIAKKTSHLFITCNNNGALALISSTLANSFLFFIEGANDKGFAMTGSFTSMLLLGLCSFLPESELPSKELFEDWCSKVIQNMVENSEKIIALAKASKRRVICLGSAGFKGIAQEAHLKTLELSASLNTACFDTPLGFRHGPKSVLNDESIVFVYISFDAYTRKYDLDLLKELMQTAGSHRVVAISPTPLSNAQEYCHDEFNLPSIPHTKHSPQYLHFLSAIVIAQMYALENSLRLGIGSDNPSPSGSVNRVVKGVQIYPYKGD